jgi:hypothetical protein
MKLIRLIAVILLSNTICFCQESYSETINEDYYIKVKNNLDSTINTNINYDDPNLYKRDNAYLDSLNLLLKIALQNHPLAQTFSNSTSTLETLIPDLGYGKLDGLEVVRDTYTITYTTKKLLDNYGDGYYNFDKLNTIDLGNIFHSLLADVSVRGIWSTEIKPFDGIEKLYFVIALESQDPYYLQQKTVYAIWNIKNHIYILRPDSIEIELNECDSIWESASLNKNEKLEEYKRNNPDLTNIDDIIFEKEAFYEYGQCYNSDTNQKIIEKAQKEITLLIKKIIEDNNRSRKLIFSGMSD